MDKLLESAQLIANSWDPAVRWKHRLKIAKSNHMNIAKPRTTKFCLGNKSFARPISSPHCFARRGAFMRTVVLAATVLAAHDMSSSSPKMCLCEIIVDLDWAR